MHCTQPFGLGIGPFHCGSFASEFFGPLSAFFAFYIAAPVKLALTVPCSDDLMSIVPTSAAQKLATVRTQGCSVTLPLHRARNSFQFLLVTVIRRLANVNQLFRRGLLTIA